MSISGQQVSLEIFIKPSAVEYRSYQPEVDTGLTPGAIHFQSFHDCKRRIKSLNDQ